MATLIERIEVSRAISQMRKGMEALKLKLDYLTDEEKRKVAAALREYADGLDPKGLK